MKKCERENEGIKRRIEKEEGERLQVEKMKVGERAGEENKQYIHRIASHFLPSLLEPFFIYSPLSSILSHSVSVYELEKNHFLLSTRENCPPSTFCQLNPRERERERGQFFFFVIPSVSDTNQTCDFAIETKVRIKCYWC